MLPAKSKKPVILALSAHDPSGAAGIQADMETVNHYRCHCVSVITALTAQNTGKFDSILPQNPIVFRQQAELLLADIKVHACKVGLIGSDLLVHEISEVLDSLNGIQVVLDPVLHSGTGSNLSSEDIVSALKENLMPKVTVLTPNIKEALTLSGRSNPADSATVLLETGCKNVLITGADQSSDKVINVLYRQDHEPIEYVWDKLDGSYHGSGCTLASALTCELAGGNDIPSAVQKAQEYTIQSLKHAVQLGNSQFHPQRQQDH
ncbi:MAG: hydroxymethylpyrimidine/phosphomethylpyrimidine kinase [Gammaproteobacteria bacterium]|nr:hydroxymethylpyrimidine/phosphomethylpyrimidine kinase [Gammaproteobacteria bacterium]